MRFVAKAYVWILVATAFILSVRAEDEVGIRSGGVYFNGTKRIPSHVWMTADFGGFNKTDKERKMKFKVRPMNQDNYAVYEYVTKLPPDSRTTFSVPISGGATKKYALDLMLDGHQTRGSASREHLAIVSSKHHRMVAIMNDDDDLVTGKLSDDISAFHHRYLTSFLSLSSLPRNWVAFDAIDTLLFQAPDVDSMTTRQLAAVKDYVVRGGTVIFNNPKGILSLAGTPLEELLPVRPLQVRSIEVLDALKSIGGTRVASRDGFDFLDSIPVQPGITTLAHEGFPLVRWRRYGLGYVGVCMVDPSGKVFLRRNRSGLQNYYAFYRHLLGYGNQALIANSSRDTSLSRSVDKLTGVKIPSSGTIRTIVGIYLIVFFALIIVGAKLRKHVEAWGALTAFAAVLVIGTYISSAVMRSTLPKKTATVLSFTTRSETTEVTENLCSLMVKGEERMDFQNPSSDVLLRPMPSPWTPKSLEKAKARKTLKMINDVTGKADKKAGGKKEPGQEVLTDPLQITYLEGRACMLNLTLRDSKPRFFNTSLPGVDAAPMTLPELKVENGSFIVPSWDIPTGSADYAALVLEDGFIRMTIKNGSLSLAPPYSTKEVSDPVVRNILEYLGRAGRGVPMIALFADGGVDRTGLISEDFNLMGKQITCIPVREIFGGEPVKLPKERLRISGYFQNWTSARVDGIWVEGGNQAPNQPIQLGARLPFCYRLFSPTRMEISMDAENRGGNILFDVYLLPDNKIAKKIKLQQNEDGLYVLDFESAPKDAVRAVNRADGMITFAVEVKTKTMIKDPVARAKMNRWKIRNISVSVTGKLPKDQQGSL